MPSRALLSEVPRELMSGEIVSSCRRTEIVVSGSKYREIRADEQVQSGPSMKAYQQMMQLQHPALSSSSTLDFLI